MASDRHNVGNPPRPARRPPGGSRGGRTVWESPAISSEEVEALLQRFPSEVCLPEERVRAVSEEWRAKALVAMPLGRRVPAEVVAREVRQRGNLKGDVFGLEMEEKVVLLRFTEEDDRTRVLHRPWVVNGQPLAVEPWRPWFFPSSTAIQSAVVWLRLPSLPVEYWEEDLIRMITEAAGSLVSLDDCTVQRRRLGFARAAVRIDLRQPLRPGVAVAGRGGRYWQRFVYEQLGGVCFACGLFHGEEGRCSASVGGPSALIRPENITVEAGNEGVAALPRPVLGPWIAAVRRWLPSEKTVERPDLHRGNKVEAPRSKVEEKGKGPDTVGGCSGASPAADGWTKPAKIARRKSPARSTTGVAGTDGASGSGTVFGFDALSDGALLQKAQDGDDATRGSGHPKRARSPSGKPRKGPAGGQPVKVVLGQQGLCSGEPSRETSGVWSRPSSMESVLAMGGDQGSFVFSAGSPSTDPLIPGSVAKLPAGGAEPQYLTHEEAAGRLRHAIQGEGEALAELSDSSMEVLGDHREGPSVRPPPFSS